MATPTASARRSPGAAPVVGVALTLLLAGVLLWWAKWHPYELKIGGLVDSRAWSGSSILTTGDVHPGDAPSWHAATSFLDAYVTAIWKALATALVVSAAVQALVPRAWLVRVLSRRRPLTGSLTGALAATPTMMCTCCAAPVAATLRRSGVPTGAALAYWLGNPLLNPAVLAFLFLVAPWQWGVTRLVVGGFVAIVGAAVVARLAERRTVDVPALADEPSTDGAWLAGAPERFVRALVRLCLTLLPEYLVVVALLGGLRGWLVPRGDLLHAGLATVLVLALIGTLLVIPTAAEIPITQALVLAGLTAGGAGALLLTLPAASAPGMAMVVRSFGWRVTGATAVLVAAGGALAGGLLALLS